LVEAHVPAVGLTPSGTVVAEDIRDLQSWAAHAGVALCGRLGLRPPPRPLVFAAEPRKRALDGGDAACGHASVARRCVQLGMSKQSLDQPDVDAALEQMRGEAVAKRMQADALPDAGSVRRLVKEPAELARRQMQPRSASWEQPALLRRHAGIVAGRPRLPPLP